MNASLTSVLDIDAPSRRTRKLPAPKWVRKGSKAFLFRCVSSVLFAHPNVANAAVVGMPDPRLGERICAFVILSDGDGLPLSEVQRWMAESGMAKQKWPERVEVVDELPMTPSRKVQKFHLRQLISDTLSREGGD